MHSSLFLFGALLSFSLFPLPSSSLGLEYPSAQPLFEAGFVKPVANITVDDPSSGWFGGWRCFALNQDQTYYCHFMTRKNLWRIHLSLKNGPTWETESLKQHPVIQTGNVTLLNAESPILTTTNFDDGKQEDIEYFFVRKEPDQVYACTPSPSHISCDSLPNQKWHGDWIDSHYIDYQNNPQYGFTYSVASSSNSLFVSYESNSFYKHADGRTSSGGTNATIPLPQGGTYSKVTTVSPMFSLSESNLDVFVGRGKTDALFGHALRANLNPTGSDIKANLFMQSTPHNLNVYGTDSNSLSKQSLVWRQRYEADYGVFWSQNFHNDDNPLDNFNVTIQNKIRWGPYDTMQPDPNTMVLQSTHSSDDSSYVVDTLVFPNFPDWHTGVVQLESIVIDRPLPSAIMFSLQTTDTVAFHFTTDSHGKPEVIVVKVSISGRVINKMRLSEEDKRTLLAKKRRDATNCSMQRSSCDNVTPFCCENPHVCAHNIICGAVQMSWCPPGYWSPPDPDACANKSNFKGYFDGGKKV